MVYPSLNHDLDPPLCQLRHNLERKHSKIHLEDLRRNEKVCKMRENANFLRGPKGDF